VKGGAELVPRGQHAPGTTSYLKSEQSLRVVMETRTVLSLPARTPRYRRTRRIHAVLSQMTTRCSWKRKLYGSKRSWWSGYSPAPAWRPPPTDIRSTFLGSSYSQSPSLPEQRNVRLSCFVQWERYVIVHEYEELRAQPVEFVWMVNEMYLP
jgi:hypothetical protein